MDVRGQVWTALDSAGQRGISLRASSDLPLLGAASRCASSRATSHLFEDDTAFGTGGGTGISRKSFPDTS
eukprot:227315-Chlamydomonas_euryale.AAC.1